MSNPLNDPKHIAELANQAVKSAIKDHHQNGRSVFYAENGNLIEHHPNGNKTVIKKLSKKEPNNLRKYLGKS